MRVDAEETDDDLRVDAEDEVDDIGCVIAGGLAAWTPRHMNHS